jgi:hypothetical protein
MKTRNERWQPPDQAPWRAWRPVPFVVIDLPHGSDFRNRPPV